MVPVPASLDPGSPVAATRVAAILGQPVRHSLSPAMQNAAFRAAGLDWCYLAFDVAPGEIGRALDAARALDFIGLNITAPHKEATARAVDRLEGTAARIGMVNTVACVGDELVGHSTDGEGFMAALDDQGVSCDADTKVVVLGAGGAAVSVAAALLERGAQLTLLNRSPARLARALRQLDDFGADRLAGGGYGDGVARKALGAAALVVSTLPLAAGVPPLDLDCLSPQVAVCDLGYASVLTPLLAVAEKHGVQAAWNGLGMLVHQGAASFRIWTGQAAPLPVMARAVGYVLPAG